jgi:hypothetical protein
MTGSLSNGEYDFHPVLPKQTKIIFKNCLDVLPRKFKGSGKGPLQWKGGDW